MMKFQLITLFMVIVAVLTTTGLFASNESVQMLAFHATNSPVEITYIQRTDDPEEYQISLINKMDAPVIKITLKGISFDSNDAMIGGFLNGKEINLQPKESKTILFKFKYIANAKYKIALPSLEQLFNKGNSIILVPCGASIRLKSNEKSEETVEYSWKIDSRLLQGLTPQNIATFQKVQGKMIENHEFENPEEMCWVCEQCSDESYTCGLSKIGSQCRSYACTQSYTCSCPDYFCHYICKSEVNCC